jgi:probable phosphoglycerate mutase
MRQCILHIVRHGQTAWNAERRLQGHADIPLNETGMSEAEMVAVEYKGHSFAAVYSSPLKRAYETARIINRPHGHEIKTHDALKEATYGSLEGIHIDDYQKKCAEHLESFRRMTYRERIHFKLVPDAESYFEIYERVKPFLDEVVANHLGEEILIVSHGGLMRAVIAVVGDIDVREVNIQNGGCLALVGDSSKIGIRDYKRIKIESEL